MPSLSPAILSIITPFALLFSHPSWTKAVTLFIEVFVSLCLIAFEVLKEVYFKSG